MLIPQLTHAAPSTARLAATCCHFPEAPDTRSSAAYPALPQPGLAPLRANLCRETPTTVLFLDSWPAKAASPNLLIWGS